MPPSETPNTPHTSAPAALPAGLSGISIKGTASAASTLIGASQRFAASPKERPAIWEEALAQLQNGAFKAAIASAQTLALRDPADPRPHVLMAEASCKLDAMEDAVGHFSAAIARDPSNTGLRDNLAAVFLKLGRHADAIAVLRELADEFEGHPTVANLLCEANALMAIGERADAIERVLDALDQEPTHPKAMKALHDLCRQAVDAIPVSPRLIRAIIASMRHPDFNEPLYSSVASNIVMRGLELLEDDQRHLLRLEPILQHLALTVMSHGFVLAIEIEEDFKTLRREILQLLADRGDDQSTDENAVLWAEAFALHSFFVEHVWSQSDEEQATADALEARVVAALQSGAPVSAAELFILGAYRELVRIPEVRRWVAGLAAQPDAALDPTLELLVLNPQQEARIAEALPAITPVEDETSQAVRAQYEANPYPRWRTAPASNSTALSSLIGLEIAPNSLSQAETAAVSDASPTVLIAGCGTGRHPIGVARRVENANVLAIDLSRASLAYAARQAKAHNVTNIAFAQADILKLAGMDGAFDTVEAMGVIHHMREPEAGLERLVATLKPGGFLRLGLYSERARQPVVDARDAIAKRGYQSDLHGIRRFREDYRAGLMPEIGKLSGWRDFFSTSELRDLVFHVMEHRYTPLQLKDMLGRHGLRFMGFLGLRSAVRADYAAENPSDPRQIDLSAWDAFEEQRPQTFLGMFQFWCRKE